MPLGFGNKSSAVDKAETSHEEYPRAPSPNRVYVPGSAEEKALVRKIDRTLIPLVWVMYILSYLDRANIGNAKSGGMEKDLALTSNQYSIVLLVFFVGYVLGEVPSNMILTRVKPSIYLPSIMFVWGGISIALAGCHSYITLSVVRALLGVVEAGFSPGVLFLLSSWYKKNELARRFAVYYTASALSGAVGGILAGAITGHLGTPSFQGWRWLFVIEGAATCVVSVVAWWFMPDYPAQTKWLSDDEKWLAAARLSSEDVGTTGAADTKHDGHWASFKQCVRDWRTWCMVFNFMMVTGSQTIQYFIPTLMSKIGYKGTMVQYMTVPIYCVAAVFIIIFPFSSDYFKERPHHISIAMTITAVSFAIIMGLGNEHLKVQYAFLCFAVGGIYACAPLVLVWTSNVICWPAEKRAVTQAFVNALGNSASIYGSFLWPKTTAPLYRQGFAVTLGMCAALAMSAQVTRYYVNKYPYPIPDSVMTPDEQSIREDTKDVGEYKA